MKKKTLLFFYLICLFVQVFTDENYQSTPADVYAIFPREYFDTMEYFYLYKNKESIPDFLKRLCQDRTIDYYSGFLSFVFSNFKEESADWVKEIQKVLFPNQSRFTLLYSLAAAGLKQEALTIAKEDKCHLLELHIIENAKLPNFESLSLREETLHSLWTAFSVTGDAQYVKRVIDMLDTPLSEGISEEELNQIKSLAFFSLDSCVGRHQKVYDVC